MKNPLKMLKKLKKEVEKVKKHRHKWTNDWCDCPFCGGHKSCDCGEVIED